MPEEEIGLRLTLRERRAASRGLREVRQEVRGVGDEAEGSGRRAGLATRGFGALYSGMRSAAGMARNIFTGAVQYAAIGLTGLAVAASAVGISTAASMETAEIAFTTMLGSAKNAGAFLEQLKQFAATTPFGFPELQGAASSLISAGIEAEKVIPIMTTLGDVTAGMGTGSEGIQRATIALQQMTAAGKVSGEDLAQLRDAGIPVYDLLAAAMGKSKAEVLELAQAGELGEDALAAMMGALETGAGLERFSGLMDKQAESLTGVTSTLTDTVQMGLADAMEPAIPLIKRITNGVSDLATSFQPTLKGAIAGVVEIVEALWDGFDTSGVDGVADVIRTQWGTDAYNAFVKVRDVVGNLREAFTEVAVPVAQWQLARLARMLNFVADNADLVRTGVIGLLIAMTAWKVITIGMTVVMGVLRGVMIAVGIAKGIYATATVGAAAATTAHTAATNAGTIALARSKGALIGIKIATIAHTVASKAAAAATWLFNTALRANPIGIIITVLTVLGIALVTAYKKSETFRNIVQGAFKAVQTAAVFVFNWVKANWPLLLAIITGPIGMAVYLVVKYWDQIKATFLAGKALVSGAMGAMGSAIKSVFQGAVSFVADGATSLIEGVMSIPGRIGELGGSFLSAGADLIGKFVEGLMGIGGMAADIASSVWNAFKRMVNTYVIDPINSILDYEVNIGITSFRLGGDLSLPTLEARERGGPVTAGQPYIVGERRPELFVPERSGYILPSVPDLDVDSMVDDAFAGGDVTVGPGANGEGTVVQVLLPDGRVLVEFILDELERRAVR